MRGGKSYTIGYQIAPENWRKCASKWPKARSGSRSIGRESFWLKSLVLPSSTARPESPIGPSVGRHQGHHHDPQAVQLDRLGAARLHEAVEADLAKLLFEMVDRVFRQQHDRVLVDVVAQELGVEMVVVQVRHIEVVGAGDRFDVHVLVAGKGEPGGEEGRVEPRVTEDRPVVGLDVQAGLSEKSYPHVVCWS